MEKDYEKGADFSAIFDFQSEEVQKFQIVYRLVPQLLADGVCV
jgi:hypothetical protein